ncbi:MAG: hypothetical protein PF689_11050 [Deltaproteobacteria bacterium]|nr:hypothetical protein [Deltaproteobacteria bacterium]
MGNHIINLPFDGNLSNAGDHAAYVVRQFDSNSRLFVQDNLCQKVIDAPSISEWNTVYNNHMITQAETSPVDLSEFEILPSSEVEEYVLSHAGAFFWNRDITDANIIEKVENRAEGQMRHSVDDYLATARNLQTTSTTGDLSGGYNWENNPQTLVISYNETSGGDIIGPVTLDLTANCANITEVVAHINSVLPTELEYARMNEVVDLNLVEIHTTQAGDGSFIVIHSRAPQPKLSASLRESFTGIPIMAMILTVKKPPSPYWKPPTSTPTETLIQILKSGHGPKGSGCKTL